MRLPLRLLVMAVLAVVPVVWFAGHGVPSLGGALRPQASPAASRAVLPPAAAAPIPTRGRSAPAATSRVRPRTNAARRGNRLPHIARRVAGALGRIAIILVALCAPILACRLRARRRRRVARYRIACPRAEGAALERVAGLLEAWHRILQRERGLTRLLFGQPHLALEWHSLPDPDHPGAPCEVVACVVCPPELAAELDRGLAACYPNARLGYEFRPPPAPWEAEVTWTGRMVRLVKERPFLLRVGAMPERGEGLAVLEAAMAAAGARQSPVGVQIRLAPAPRLAERWARRRLAGREREVDARRRRELRAGAGLGAPSARRELEGGLELVHRGLFWSEVWVLGADEQGVRAVAGTLQSAGGENFLARRRAWSPLHRRRVQRAQLGFLAPSLMGAAEIACLWHLPAPAAGAVAARRNHLPRLPAPREVPRAASESEALVEDERGPLTLPAQARLLGLAVDGLSGTGKTETLAAVARLAAADPEAWLCVLDPKSDLVERALSVIPEGRRVRVLNFAEPTFGINPLEQDADPEAIAEAVIGALRDVHEEGDIRASSDRYLRLSITAAIAYSRSVGMRPTLWLVKDLLDPSAGEELRRWVVRVAQRDPALAHVATFFDRTLPDQLANARTMTTTKLDAPANKLYRFLGQVPDRVLHHPAQLRIEELVRAREILIVDGAMGRVGEDTSRKLMQILMRLIYAALQRQQELPVSERVRMCVVFDEAHFILNPTIAKAAAVGRSGLLELAAGFQQLAQFQDPVVRAMVEDLLQHQLTFRAAAEDARQAASQAMQSYADVIRDDPQARALQRVAPDMLTNLPDHHCLCSWVVAGTRQPAFLARTLRVAIDHERIRGHLTGSRSRPARGGVAPHFPPALPNAAAPEPAPLDRDPLSGGRENGAEPPALRPQRPQLARRQPRVSGAGAPVHGASPSRRDGSDVSDAAPAGPEPLVEPETPPAAVTHPDETLDRRGEREAAREANDEGQDPDAAAGGSSPAPLPTPPAPEPEPEPERLEANATAGRQQAGDGHAAPNRARPTPTESADLVADQPAGPVAPEEAAPARKRPQHGTEGEMAAQETPAQAAGAIESYLEVQIDAPLGLIWDRPPQPPPPRRAAGAAELQALQLLYRAGFLLSSQLIREGTWTSLRTAQRSLAAMAAQGWVRRCSFRTEQGGRNQFVYMLAKDGLAAARDQMSLFGPYATPEAGWREPDVQDPRRVLHDLHAVGWLLALCRALPRDMALGWHGSRAPLARPEPRLRGRPGDRRVIEAREVPVDPARAIAELRLERFVPIHSDGMVELAIDTPSGRRRIDCFLELDRTRKPGKNAAKFAAYDAFITAWSVATSRYQKLADRPVVVFVCEDEPQARAFVRAADEHVTGRLITLKAPPDQWAFPGRERMYFCCERDVHEGRLRAWQLPRLPPDLRVELGQERAPEPQQVQLIAAELIGRARRVG